MACDPLDDAAKHEALLSPLDLDAEPPESFHVTFETTKGNFTVLFERNLAPLGVKRLYNLVANKFYDGARFYRVLKNWVCQFGVSPDPAVSAVYDYTRDVPGAILENDEVRASNVRGTVAFSSAMEEASGKSVNRTTELYINYLDSNARLDSLGFAPVGRVVRGMGVVEDFYAGYGEMVDACDLHPEKGNLCKGVNETLLYTQGEAYLSREFPKLDVILSATLDGHACSEQGAGAQPASLTVSVLVALIASVLLCFVFAGHKYGKRRERDQQVQLRAYTNLREEDDDGEGDGG